MQNDKIVVGLDIGTTKICVIVGRLNDFGKLEILGMGKAVSEGVTRGLVTNIDKTVSGITKAIKEAEEQASIDIRVVNVGIAGQYIKSSRHRGSIIRNNGDDEITVEDINRLNHDMYRIVIPPGNQIIHVIPQDYSVDYESGIKDPVGMSGVRLEADFHIITANANAINNVTKCVKKAGLEIESLILEPIASSLGVLTDEEKEAGVALVDIGGGTTDIAIFHDNILRHSAVIALGGNIITSDIKQGCMVMQNQAELLKTKFGNALSSEAKSNEIISIAGLRNRPPKEISVKNLAYIIEARMEEIIDHIYAEIIQSGYENKLAGGIVITGGGAQLLHIKSLFEFTTGMDTRIGYPNEHLGKSKLDLVKSPMYATAIGLVLAGYKSVDERENNYAQLQQNFMQKPIVSGNLTQTSTPKIIKKENRTGGSSDFFKRWIDKTKGLLIDDMDDKEFS